jgi:hypothetical protein
VVQTKNAGGKAYSRDDIDFLVAYIFAEDLWYVFPVHVCEQKKSLCVKPGSKKSRLEQYREKWDLMRSSGPPPVQAPTAPPSHGEAAAESPLPVPGT